MDMNPTGEYPASKETHRKISSMKRTDLYKSIRGDIINQLERSGTYGSFYLDLVDDYMDLWITKRLLVEDIQERGISVIYCNGGGQFGRKKNESVEQRIKVNAQMLKILNDLGIKAGTQGTPGGDEDDL